jgi:hypothetical protein
MALAMLFHDAKSAHASSAMFSLLDIGSRPIGDYPAIP